MFNHSDRHDDTHSEGPNHTDENRSSYGDYSEREGHSDYRSNSRVSHEEHVDRTKHEDHQDFQPCHSEEHSDSRDSDGIHDDEGYGDRGRYDDHHVDRG